MSQTLASQTPASQAPVAPISVNPAALDPATTALVLIDLQNGIVALPLAPRSGDAAAASGRALAERFRAAGAPVVLVRVGWSADYGDAPRQPVDQPMSLPAGGLPTGWSDYIDGLVHPGDILVQKRQWGAFHGTDLDLHLRRRGIRTIVLAGIATNIGVESTARAAWEHGYNLILAEDATTSLNADAHAFSITTIMPRLSQVRDSKDIGFAITSGQKL